MNLARRGSPPRAERHRANASQPDVIIDLTTDSESDSDAPLGSRNKSRLSSETDSEDDLFIAAARPARPQPRQAQSPQRQVLMIESPSPEPEAHQPVQPPELRQPARLQLSISPSPEFQAARPVRLPLHQDRLQLSSSPSPSPSPSPDYEIAMAANPARRQDAFYESDSDSPAPNPRPAPDARENDQHVQRGIMGDYVLDEEFDDAMIAQLMGQFEEVHQQNGPADFQQDFQQNDWQEAVNAPELPPAQPIEHIAMETKPECIENVILLFPGICEDYVSEKYDTVSKSSDRLIAYILDKIEKGTDYPKAKDKQKVLKRKREVDEDEEAARKYGALDRIIPSVGGINTGIRGYIRTILSQEFAETPMTFIDATLGQSGHRLFSAYRVLEEAQRTFDVAEPPYNKIKKHRAATDYKDERLPMLMAALGADHSRVEILEELIAARRIRRKADQKRLDLRQAELDEEENTRRAEAEGTMSECGCCMGDYPLNRMIHCDGEEIHWFCRGCALKTAETEIENARYELKCMSMDGCIAGFSMEQRSHFLDANTIVALERNEQESNLRLAGIENLASCPFCPYAAEYPPIEINREFQCKRPDCEKVSCRLCKLESHIPKSCEEHAKENGLSIRRQIEEAMSAAMIRKCNKCQTPFIKEEGCNKMTCTRNGCHNIQCYVCSKSCGYDHFNDASRGGKPGNCPLFESAEQRHDQEVKEAERIAMEKVQAEHPEYTEEDLRVKMSKEVQKDDERRKANDPQARLAAIRAAQGMGPGHGIQPMQNVFAAPARYHRRHRRVPVAIAHPVVPLAPALPAAYAQGVLDPFEEPMYDDWYGFDDGDDVLDLLGYRAPILGPVNPAGQILAAQAQAVIPNNQADNGIGLQAHQIQRQQEMAAQMRAQAQLQLQQQVEARFQAAVNHQEQVAPQELFENPENLAYDPVPPPQAPQLFNRVAAQQLAAQDLLLQRRLDAQAAAALHQQQLQQQLVAQQRQQAALLQERQELEELKARSAAIDQQLVDLRVAREGRAQPRRVAALPNNFPPNPPNLDMAGPINQMQLLQDNIDRLQNAGMRAGREQQIIDHAERRIQRRQEVARLRREQEDDEAALARRLAAARQNGAASAEGGRNPWGRGKRETRVKPEEDDEMDM